MTHLMIKYNSYWTITLLTLLLLYTLKGALYPTGFLSKFIALIELGVCLILGYKSLKFKYRSIVINILYIIVGIITLYYLISDKYIYYPYFGKTTSFIFFRALYGAVLPALAMYYLSRSGQISYRILVYFFYLMFFASIIAFFYETVTTMIEKNQEITSNESYRFVYIMPFVVILKGKIKILLLWIIAITITLLSAKRGAILGLSIECIAYYWWCFWSSRHKFSFFLGIIVICIVSGHIIYEYYQNDLYFQVRVESTLEGKTSGRDVLVSKLINHFLKADMREVIVGAGFAQTFAIAGNYAHNDWIEFLIDFGLIGFCVYLSFYLALLYTINNSRNAINKGLWMIFIALLPSTFYSMVFFSESTSMCFVFLGYILGYRDRHKHLFRFKDLVYNERNKFLSLE